MIFRALPLLALLTFLVACQRHDSARDEQLKQALITMRQSIARFHAGQGRYPRSLDELVPRYLPAIPEDPFTRSPASWRVTTEETVQPSTDFQSDVAPASSPVIIDVRSTAPGADPQGVLYSNY